jgi:hypothetical protein
MRRARTSSLLLVALAVAVGAGVGGCGGDPPTVDTAPPTVPVADAGSAQPAKDVVAPVAAPTSGVDPASGLIIDDGWELVASSCTACHSSKLVTQNAGDERYWAELITWMQKTQNLWPIPEPSLGTIVGYLAKNYPSKKLGRRPALATDLLPPGPPASADDPRVRAAQQALGPLKKSLKGALLAALPKGADTAVDACHAQAQPLTAAANSGSVVVGRTSHRLRNRANAPAPWMRPLLAELVRAPKTPFLTTTLDDGRLGYLEPIGTGPPCLKCHGADVAPAVVAKIDARYPDDDARGFALGDTRGAFWAIVAPTGSSNVAPNVAPPVSSTTPGG